MNGKFHVEGTVNRACEALVWTDLSQKAFDGPTMFRFLLQPGHTAVSFDGSRVLVTGSRAQAEKDSWDGARRDLEVEKDRCVDTVVALNKLLQERNDTALLVHRERVQARRTALMRVVEDSAIKYIERNPNSYFSGQLLYHNRRRMSVDSLPTIRSSGGRIRWWHRRWRSGYETLIRFMTWC